MKIKRYKLKDGVTKEELIAFGAKEGGSFAVKGATLLLHKFCCCHFKDSKGRFSFEFTIYIGFKNDISDWNDFDNVLILDDDFGQPYTPFYGENFGKEIKNFPVLEECIRQYNEYMDSIPFLVQIKE